MKIKELVTQLKKLDQNLLVVMSVDPEGNGFYELGDVDGVNSAYSDGEVGLISLTSDMRKKGFRAEDCMESGTPCVVLWPQ
jgi:hypothetical protein